MNHLKQFVIILVICLIGELLVNFLPFGFPGNVMAMMLLAGLLVSRVVKEEQIKAISDFLLETIGLFIVPVSVGVIEHVDLIQTVGIQLLLISLITLVVTFASCAFTIRLVISVMNLKQKEKI
ncbi:MAG: CidA/LrgA family protein [Defluviitaleaceae bacterium]|nr:CidA/LrgA family protein [Defluviitaleaceae bacterium]